MIAFSATVFILDATPAPQGDDGSGGVCVTYLGNGFSHKRFNPCLH